MQHQQRGHDGIDRVDRDLHARRCPSRASPVTQPSITNWRTRNGADSDSPDEIAFCAASVTLASRPHQGKNEVPSRRLQRLSASSPIASAKPPTMRALIQRRTLTPRHRDGRAPARSARACPCAVTATSQNMQSNTTDDIGDPRRSMCVRPRPPESPRADPCRFRFVVMLWRASSDRDRSTRALVTMAGCGDSFTCRLAARSGNAPSIPEWRPRESACEVRSVRARPPPKEKKESVCVYPQSGINHDAPSR